MPEGGWALESLPGQQAAVDRRAYIRRRALTWLRRTEVVERAYQAHDPALRMLIRYGDLLSDRDGQLRSLASWLDLGYETTGRDPGSATEAGDRPAEPPAPG